MTTPVSSTVGTPGALLASIPAVLGFYPRESIVFCTVVTTREGASLLGPVIRINITDVHMLDEVGDTLSSFTAHRVEGVFAFIISASAESLCARSSDIDCPGDDAPAILRQADRALRSAASSGTLQLLGAWMVPEILTGERYKQLFSRLASWRSPRGIIPEITETATMRLAISRGSLPELNRADLLRRFEPDWRYVSESDAREIARQAERRSREALQLPDAEFRDLLKSVVRDAEIIVCEIGSDADVADLESAMGYLAHYRFRDAVLGLAVEHPAAVARFALLLARNSVAEVRANALCWYAVAEVANYIPARALPAVEAALNTVRGHQLSELLARALQCGAHELVLEAACRCTRELR